MLRERPDRKVLEAVFWACWCLSSQAWMTIVLTSAWFWCECFDAVQLFRSNIFLWGWLFCTILLQVTVIENMRDSMSCLSRYVAPKLPSSSSTSSHICLVWERINFGMTVRTLLQMSGVLFNVFFKVLPFSSNLFFFFCCWKLEDLISTVVWLQIICSSITFWMLWHL